MHKYKFHQGYKKNFFTGSLVDWMAIPGTVAGLARRAIGYTLDAHIYIYIWGEGGEIYI